MNALKKYLVINGLFSVLSGVGMILFRLKLQILFNVINPYIFPVIGFLLLIFVFFVFFISKYGRQNPKWVSVISILDIMWVIGSLVIVFFKLFDLSITGYILISVVAMWVGFLAYKQIVNNR